MSYSEFPKSLDSIEKEQPLVTDSNQIQQQELLPEQHQPPQQSPKRRWFLILGIFLLIVGVGIGWRWWYSSASSAPKEAGAAGKPMGIPVKLATVETGTVQETTDSNAKKAMQSNQKQQGLLCSEMGLTWMKPRALLMNWCHFTLL